MRLRQLLLLSLSAALGACQTSVAMVDDAYGYERRVGDHAIRMHAMRAELDAAAPTDGAVVVDVPVVEDGIDAGPAGGTYRLFVRVTLHNRGASAWTLPSGALKVDVREPGKDQPLRVTTAPGTGALATVAPGEVRELEIPIFLRLPANVRMRDVERFWLGLRFEESGTTMLDRRLVIGTYNQGWQLARFAGVLTLLLILA